MVTTFMCPHESLIAVLNTSGHRRHSFKLSQQHHDNLKQSSANWTSQQSCPWFKNGQHSDHFKTHEHMATHFMCQFHNNHALVSRVVTTQIASKHLATWQHIPWPPTQTIGTWPTHTAHILARVGRHCLIRDPSVPQCKNKTMLERNSCFRHQLYLPTIRQQNCSAKTRSANKTESKITAHPHLPQKWRNHREGDSHNMTWRALATSLETNTNTWTDKKQNRSQTGSVHDNTTKPGMKTQKLEQCSTTITLLMSTPEQWMKETTVQHNNRFWWQQKKTEQSNTEHILCQQRWAKWQVGQQQVAQCARTLKHIFRNTQASLL